MKSDVASAWPVLCTYEGARLRRVALPLGGIGTGTVSLGGRGDLWDWEMVNRPAKGFTPGNAFFALFARPHGGEPVTRALEGQIPPEDYEGDTGSHVPNHGLPRFAGCRFETAYPLGQVVLHDPDVPLGVRLQAFNPLVPCDPDRSGIPLAALRFVLTNHTDAPVSASVCGSLRNFVGTDGTRGAPKANRNEYRESDGLRGVFMRSDGVSPDAEQWGTVALAVTGEHEVTHRTAWPELSWGGGLLDFWDDFSSDGRLEERDAASDSPTTSLAASLEVPPDGDASVTFLLAWHFPNRMSWNPGSSEGCCDGGSACEGPEGDRVGNYYATRYADAWDVLTTTFPELARLEAETVEFVSAFVGSDLPDAVKEAALFNLSTLRSQTCFRTSDSRFYGWEGCNDRSGCCHGSCTHVWNYEQATAFLFGSLSRSMREVELVHATDDRGLMSFRVHLPLARARDWHLAAADGQMGCVMKLYRDWQLSGDDGMLRSLWPQAKRALEFCWIPGGWDADRDGVMEGCQHNTMDVEYYGPNPQMGTWYLGALRAAEEMARYLGEEDFARTCRDLFAHGSEWLDEHLFNGEYYEHRILPPGSEEDVADGLRHESMGARELSNPDLQLGAGCLIDQLVGQYFAHVCGLGYLLRKDHVDATLHSLMRYNFKPSLRGHFNYMRSFALGDEPAMLMCTYPRGRRPRRPFPYATEVMTGFEYTAAVHMLYEGLGQEGLRIVEAVRSRYDGLRRNPFDEAECGHHYARAMASWAAVLALTGFHYSGVEQEIEIAASTMPVRWFWSTGDAWGTVEQRPDADGIEVELRVLGGALRLHRLTLRGAGTVHAEPEGVMGRGDIQTLYVEREVE